ncbi:MAG: Cys-Gln thioester bond-forming surface protein [Oscillospiraceae bacterium]|nr:Cys-Gln thioester bond-forming surface protein [Oscillospiraceae bacterium]
MANTVKRLCALILALVMCGGLFCTTVLAAETINGNTWYGDEVSVDVTAGTEGYTFMSLFRQPVHGYEFSGHFLGDGEGPQTFVVIDTVEHNGTTWSPSGIYDPMTSNYEVAYCCDVETIIADGTYYKRMNLEDSEYYNEEQAAKIRAIVTNAYPYVSLEAMKADLAENGYAYAAELTRNEALAAVQAAIWASANGKTAGDFLYQKSYKVSDNLQWGYPLHDTSAESGLNVAGKRVFETYKEVGTRIDSLVEYLLAQEATYAEKAQIVITKLELNGEPVLIDDNNVRVNLNMELNNSGSGYEDDIKIKVLINGTAVQEIPVVLGQETYALTVDAGRSDTVTAVVEGTQVLPLGVYFYAPRPADTNGDGIATSREVSQNLVDVNMGPTKVYAEASLDLSAMDIPLPPLPEPEPMEMGNKTSELLDREDDRYEISVSVPGQDGYTLHDEVILMVDGSYSGDKEWPAMKEAINAIGEAVLNGSGSTKLTLMAFGMGDNEVLVQIDDAADLAAALGELPGNLLRGVSSTNCEAGFTGVDEYIRNHSTELHDAVVVYITDGGINTDETRRDYSKWADVATSAANVRNYAFNYTDADLLTEALSAATGYSTLEEAKANATEEQLNAAVTYIWETVFAYSGMDLYNKTYPISEAERAFLKYDEEHTAAATSFSFLIAMKGSAYDKYPDVWNRTYNSVFALAENTLVERLYLVRYQNDGRATWMPDAAAKSETDNIYYVKSDSITTLTDALQDTLTELSIAPFNDVVVTDYMSKWVNLDAATLKIVDNTTGEVIWSAQDGWKIENVEDRPTAQEVPVTVEKVEAADYAAGGDDVTGNTSGDIYKLTWYVKDGAMLRADTYSLKYEVTVDTAENGFVYEVELPANGNTDLTYTDKNGDRQTNEIEVPDVEAEKPVPTVPEIPGTSPNPVDKETTIDKTAEELDENDQTDVTLSISTAADESIDVVLILGGSMQANRETVDSAINLFKPLMEAGKTSVKLGLIALERGQEVIMELTELDPATYAALIEEKFAYINSLPVGTTNLHSQLVEAKRMLDNDTAVDFENKYVFVMATGRTYWFDDAYGDQSTIVNKVNDTYYWGHYLWQSQRGGHTSLYMIPARYNNSWDAYWADVCKWVQADQNAYVYSPLFDKNDVNAYATWYANNGKDLRALGLEGSRFGNGIVNPVPTAENFLTKTPAAIGSGANPQNALNYERAQYEAARVYAYMVNAGYHCYAICSESPNYQNGSEYITQGAGYTGTSTIQLGHSFMNYLARLGGQAEAPTVWDYTRDEAGNFVSATTVLDENFFEPIIKDVMVVIPAGSYVEDFIGKNDNGNFEFIEDAANLILTLDGEAYTAAKVTTKEGATGSFSFTAPGAAEPAFLLDYYYGDGETTEKFVWTFCVDIMKGQELKLTYKLQLTEKQTVAGEYIVNTNNSATLYPEGGNPKDFPVPEVDYPVEETPDVPPVVSFQPGQASNISFMLIDPATGAVEFLYKIDIENETSFEIPSEEGKISAVFIKQSTSGLFWTAEEVDEATQQAVIDCLKANNPSYKGHNAFVFGTGDHELEYKNNKFATYTFSADGAAAVIPETDVPAAEAPEAEEPVVEEPVVEEPVVEPEVEEPVVEPVVEELVVEPEVEEPVVEPEVEEPVVEPEVEESVVEEPAVEEKPFELNLESGKASGVCVVLIDKATGAVEFLETTDIKKQTSVEIASVSGKITAVYIRESNSGMLWFSEEVDEATQQAVIACLKGNYNSYKDADAIVFGEGDHALTAKNGKSSTYAFARKA